MKLNKKVLTLVVLGGLSVSGNSLAGPTALDLANTCAGCHGVDGNSVGPATPSLAGISKDYFTETMMNYKDPEDARASTIMSRIAKGYSDEEIELMAGYFAAQKMVRLDQKHDPKLASKGAKLHKKYCEKCHEDGGRSAEDDSGILAGQWKHYLEFTMTDFINGDRDMPKKMKKQVEKLTEKEGDAGLQALLNYYASQK